MSITPLFDRLVLKDEKQKQNKGTIIVPDIAEEKSIIAVVTHVGTGGKIDGNEIEFKVAVGDRVIYNKFAGHEFILDDERYILIKQEDVLAIID